MGVSCMAMTINFRGFVGDCEASVVSGCCWRPAGMRASRIGFFRGQSGVARRSWAVHGVRRRRSRPPEVGVFFFFKEKMG